MDKGTPELAIEVNLCHCWGVPFPRHLLTFLCLLALSGVAFAQQQEEKVFHRELRDKINSKNLTFIPQTGSSNPSKTFSGTSAANLKSFYFPEKFAAKDFLTGSYAGSKSCWMGDFKYNSSGANTSVGHAFPNFGTKYGTKTADTKTAQTKAAYDSTKTYGSKDFGVRDFRGKEQAKIDQMKAGAPPSKWEGSLQEIKSIDDIRALLNKNK